MEAPTIPAPTPLIAAGTGEVLMSRRRLVPCHYSLEGDTRGGLARRRRRCRRDDLHPVPDQARHRCIVRRVKPTPGSQSPDTYHAFITDRDGETLERGRSSPPRRGRERHATSSRHAVGALQRRLAGQVMAHNLARWTARIGPADRDHQDPQAAPLVGDQTLGVAETQFSRVWGLSQALTQRPRNLAPPRSRDWYPLATASIN